MSPVSKGKGGTKGARLSEVFRLRVVHATFARSQGLMTRPKQKEGVRWRANYDWAYCGVG